MTTLKKIYPTELNADFSMTKSQIEKVVEALDNCSLNGKDEKANDYTVNEFYPFLVAVLEEMESRE